MIVTLAFVALMVLLFLRTPIAVATGLVGLAGLAYFQGWGAAFSQVGIIASETVLTYEFAVIPLFIVMGAFIAHSGIAEELFRACYALVGHWRGGLALSTIVACGGFGAVSGSSLATAATMSRIAYPQMKQYGYKTSLATGSIAAGGTLGILIPPSIALVFYGIMTETDIGALFMAGIVPGIDVILSGHTHDALPEPVVVGETIIVPSGSNGKFVSRVDLDIRDGRMMGYRTKLIPIFSDVITPDADVRAIIDAERAPYLAEMTEVIGQTESLLYRRGNFNGSWDDLICDALLSEREAEIALSPGVRWGPSLIPGQDITREDIHGVTSMSYGEAYRTEMTGEFLKVVLEDVADNIFNPDPYYQQGGDMVRTGGLGYRIDVSKPQGERISNMTLLKTGEPIDPSRHYVVAGWASVNEGTEGPQIWDVVESHIRKLGTVTVQDNNSVDVVGV